MDDPPLNQNGHSEEDEHSFQGFQGFNTIQVNNQPKSSNQQIADAFFNPTPSSNPTPNQGSTLSGSTDKNTAILSLYNSYPNLNSQNTPAQSNTTPSPSNTKKQGNYNIALPGLGMPVNPVVPPMGMYGNNSSYGYQGYQGGYQQSVQTSYYSNTTSLMNPSYVNPNFMNAQLNKQPTQSYGF